MAYSVIDLFCGCGGFSKGFQNAGFEIKLGIDLWPDAIQTYSHNFPNAGTINDDISKLNRNDLESAIPGENKNIDVIIGGPPCQGFSVSGKRLLDDPRNILYKSFVNLVDQIKPKAFVMENVPGLERLFDGKVKKQVIDNFTNIGYNISTKILNASDYGVPQARKRIFFVGLNKNLFSDTYYMFPAATTHDRPLTCKDAISDLDFVPDDVSLGEDIEYSLPPECRYQELMRSGSTKLKNHSITVHKEQTKKIIAMVPDGGNYRCLPKELWETRKVHIAWTRMNSEKPCFTIDCGHNHQFHYKENRVPTVRESARIQSFPDSFEILGKRTSQYKQVGNAVPPLLAQAIAIKLQNTLKTINVQS